MAVLANNANGGTSGTTVTAANSGGASGDAFGAVDITGTFAFDSAHVHSGNLSYKQASGALSSNYVGEWTFTAVTTAYFRIYPYLTGNPPADMAIFLFVDSGGATLRGRLSINATGKVCLADAAQTIVSTSTASISTGSWVRLEGFVTGSTTVGQLECKIYNSPDSTIPTETLTSAATLNTGGTVAQIWIGDYQSNANIGPYWVDDIKYSSVGYGDLGPTGLLGHNKVITQAVNRSYTY